MVASASAAWKTPQALQPLPLQQKARLHLEDCFCFGKGPGGVCFWGCGIPQPEQPPPNPSVEGRLQDPVACTKDAKYMFLLVSRFGLRQDKQLCKPGAVSQF